MKVLHVQRAGGVSGSERHLLALLPGLRDLGLDVEMAVLEAPGGDRFSAAMRDSGVPTMRVPMQRSVSGAAVAALRDRVRSSSVDILHSHLIHADVLASVVRASTRVTHVSTVHSTAVHYRREPGRGLAALAGRSARRTIAISEHVARFLVRRRIVPPDRLRVIHYGIDVARWPMQLAGAGDAAEGEDVSILMASRLVPHKGHEVALRALALIAGDLPGLRLRVAGDGPLGDELLQLAAALGVADRVRFLGFVPDIGAEMAAADIVLFPTSEAFGEGFGLVNIEAMAAGRPVVASAVASMPEIVADARTGTLVPADDVAGFARALAELATDPDRRHQYGMAGRLRAEADFSLGAMVRATAATYDEVLGRPTS